MASQFSRRENRQAYYQGNTEEIDFTALKEMLPIWIAKAKEQSHD